MPRGVWDREKAKWKRMSPEEKRMNFEVEIVFWVCENAPWKDEYAPVHFKSKCMVGEYGDALKILKNLSVTDQDV